jgi:hypothetical protein
MLSAICGQHSLGTKAGEDPSRRVRKRSCCRMPDAFRSCNTGMQQGVCHGGNAHLQCDDGQSFIDAPHGGDRLKCRRACSAPPVDRSRRLVLSDGALGARGRSV